MTTQAPSKELLPCPFCGSREIDQSATYMQCRDCGADGPLPSRGKRWNDRASNEPPADTEPSEILRLLCWARRCLAATDYYRDCIAALDVEIAKGTSQPPAAGHRELIARLENISNYEPDEAWDVVVDAMKALRASHLPDTGRVERLVSAFKQVRADLALQSGTWSNAASFGLLPEDIGLERIDDDAPALTKGAGDGA